MEILEVVEKVSLIESDLLSYIQRFGKKAFYFIFKHITIDEIHSEIVRGLLHLLDKYFVENDILDDGKLLSTIEDESLRKYYISILFIAADIKEHCEDNNVNYNEVADPEKWGKCIIKIIKIKNLERNIKSASEYLKNYSNLTFKEVCEKIDYIEKLKEEIKLIEKWEPEGWGVL